MSEAKTDALVVYQEQPKPDALAVGQERSLDICPVNSTKEQRESHGQALAAKFINGVAKVAVQFIRELEPEIKQVRKDFLDKPKKELICGVRTFTEYCTAVLGYSIRHIDRILEGHNPSLTLAENKAASHRKAKRELEAKTKRAQAALPIRCKTNAEILADKKEETKAASLQQQVVTLQRELQTARQTKVSASDIATAKDLHAIHAAEVKGLETEIKKLKGSNQKLAGAYAALRSDAVHLATVGAAQPAWNNMRRIISTRLVKLSKTFLKKHGEDSSTPPEPETPTPSKKPVIAVAPAVAAKIEEAPKYLKAQADKFIKQYRDCKIQKDSWLAWIAQEDAKVKDPSSMRAMVLRDIRERAESEIQSRETPEGPAEVSVVPSAAPGGEVHEILAATVVG